MLVAEDAGEVIGVCEVDQLDGVPVMWKLYVLPDRHGEGILPLLDGGAAHLS